MFLCYRMLDLFLCTFLLLLHLGVSGEDKNKRTVKPKPITLPVDAKPPKERKYLLQLFSVTYLGFCYGIFG